MGIQDAIRNHPAIGGLVGGVAIGAGSVGIVNLIRGKAKKRTIAKAKQKRSTSATKRRSTGKARKSSKTAFQRRRAKAFRGASPKKIFHTKNGQPYIKLKSGKARFIKKSSARSRKKRKGGFS